MKKHFTAITTIMAGTVFDQLSKHYKEEAAQDNVESAREN
jgi:hypothetical protein